MTERTLSENRNGTVTPIGFIEKDAGLRKLTAGSPTAIYPDRDEWYSVPVYIAITPSPQTSLRGILQKIAAQISALTLHPTTGQEYDAGYIGARNDAFAIVQEFIDNLPPEPKPEAGLSMAEQKAQGTRCGCLGADDYCPCQNVPDAETRKARAALSAPATEVEHG